MAVRHASRPDEAAPGRRSRRPLAEAAAVSLAAGAATAAANREQVASLTTTVPGNLGDPLYFAWQLAWVGHALTTDPRELWTTNAFLGAPDSLAFTDAILGYAPLALLGQGQSGALLALNLGGLLATALSLCGAYALARVLGAGIPGALVAGAGFGFAPWRLEQVIHVNVVSTGGMALTLACLAYGHGWSLRHGWRPAQMRPGWVLAGWGVACWQLTLGFAVGIPFAYVLATAMLLWAAGWLLTGRRRLPRALVAAELAGGLAFAVLGFALTRPYLRVVEANPGAERTPAMLDLFSPPWRGLLTAPETSRFWGERQLEWRAQFSWPPEMILSPGIVLLLLAVAGLFVSAWPVRRRLALAAATALMTLLALGTQAPGGGRFSYLLLYENAPGWEALRTPGRLMIWVTLGLALLAAGAVARVADLSRAAVEGRGPRPEAAGAGSHRRPGRSAGSSPRPATVLRAGLLLVPTLVIGYEGLGDTPHWEVSRPPVDVASLPEPVLFLPSDVIGDYHMMLWSTEGWPLLANGSSGFDPASQGELRQQAQSFPDPASVAALRARGIDTVVLVRSRASGSVWDGAADRPVDGLGIGREDRGDAVVYDLRTPAAG